MPSPIASQLKTLIHQAHQGNLPARWQIKTQLDELVDWPRLANQVRRLTNQWIWLIAPTDPAARKRWRRQLNKQAQARARFRADLLELMLCEWLAWQKLRLELVQTREPADPDQVRLRQKAVTRAERWLRDIQARWVPTHPLIRPTLQPLRLRQRQPRNLSKEDQQFDPHEEQPPQDELELSEWMDE